jgi:type II restriction enzyme
MKINTSPVFDKILALSNKYSKALKGKMEARITEMQDDDNSHYLIYKVLGIGDKEGQLIDEYQNKGRFLYKYAGSFLEDAALLCFEEMYPQAKRKVRIPNKTGKRPATFEIDCLVDNDAYEIKWRDATTDGDHITKEHTRIRNIVQAGYKPIRVMFYYPNREQAIRIQDALKAIYSSVGGSYYFGEGAWGIIERKTGINLLAILEEIARKKTGDGE